MTHRRLLFSLLCDYTPATDEKEHIKEKILAFLKEHRNCFDRLLLVGHITGSAWLLDKQEEHALLLHHTKLDIWVQPGGHCDGNPDPLAVAIKETKEESGISSIIALSPAIFDLDIHRIPARGDIPEHDHLDVCFLLKVASDEKVNLNAESKGHLWISKNDRHLLPSNDRVLRLFDKWVKR